MKVLVCGGRNYQNATKVREILDLFGKDKILLVIHGGAPGADRLAGQWALRNNVAERVYHADWPKYGRRAGPIRNQQMLDEGSPHLVVAFQGGSGTADMIKRADESGVPVLRVHEGG